MRAICGAYVPTPVIIAAGLVVELDVIADPDRLVDCTIPVFPAGAGGLVGTVNDWFRFGRMLLDGGAGLLSPESVRQMRKPGRYGWAGGSGTSAHIVAGRDSVAILLTQVGMDSPVPSTLMRDFWQHSASI